MDENEIKAVAEAMEQLRQGGTLSAEQLAKLGGTTQNANKALEAYTKKILGAASAVGGMARQIEEGGGSFKSMSGSIQGVANGLGKLVGMIPGVGGALKGLTGALGEAAGYVLERMDDITKNYQALGDASAGAADGFDGLLRQFNQMGNFSLPAFTKAVKANTMGLAALGGSAAAGAEELSKVSGVLTTGDTAKQFLKLGISLDAVGDATAGYLADYARSGTLQGLTTDQLTKKTQDYILEVDKIARLTGQTRAQQEEERRKSMANAQFRAQLARMNADGQQEQSAALKNFADAMGGPAADAIRAFSTGIPLTTQAAEANLFTNDKLREVTMKVRDGQLSAAQATVELQDAMGNGVNTFSTLTAYGKDLGGMFVQAADQQAILLTQNKSAAERLADAEEAQKKQREASGELTEKFVDANLATTGVAKNIQSLGFSLASLAAGPVKRFANGLEYATGIINKRFGIGGTMTTPAGVDRGAAGGPRASMSDSDRILATIRQRESSGNYNAQARGSTASGAYQFIDSTWQGLTKKYGIGQEFGKAKLAPKEIQDAIARAYVNDILKEAGGDVSKVPLAWYTGNTQGKISASALAANNGLTPEAYQSKWMGTYNKQMSGPISQNQNNMSGINPSSAGATTTAQGERASEEQQSASSNNRLIRQLAELNQTSKDLLIVNKKILARQS
jgi:hypothetical protein